MLQLSVVNKSTGTISGNPLSFLLFAARLDAAIDLLVFAPFAFPLINDSLNIGG